MTERPVLSKVVLPRSAIFLLVALGLFHPFLGGSFLLGGTDTLFTHYPNLLFGYREFHEHGRFPLWNPYIFAGVDFTASMHAHYLNPVYWPMLLAPERYAFHVLTGMFLVFNWLIGVYWERIADAYGRSAPEAILVGIVAQAGMFFWFTATTMNGVPMYFLATTAICVVVTRARRSNWANYLMLSVSLGLLFLSGHPLYMAGFFLPVAAVFVARTWPGCLRHPLRHHAGVFVAAVATAAVLSLYRTIPVLLALTGEGTHLTQQWLLAFSNHGYYALTAFNPIAFGVNLHEAATISELLKVGGFRHTQAHNALYFGIVPLVIIYLAARAGRSRTVLALLATYLIFQLNDLYLLQPLSDVVNIIAFPVFGAGLFRPLTNFALLFLLIYSLKSLAGLESRDIGRVTRELALVAGLVIMVTAALELKILHENSMVIRIVGADLLLNLFRFAIVGVALAAIFVYKMEIAAIARPRFGVFAIVLASVAVVSCVAAGLLLRLFPGDEMTMRSYQALVALIPVVGAALVVSTQSLDPRARTLTWIGAVTVSLAIFIWPLPTIPEGRGTAATALSAAAGSAVFVMLTLAVMHLLARRATGQLDSKTLLFILVVVTTGDLVVAYSNYTYVNTPTPFVRRFEDIYPTSTLPERHARYLASLAGERALANLLVNDRFLLDSGMPAGWRFGGSRMGLCADSRATALPGGNAVHLCYPLTDKGGYLDQDIRLHDAVTRVSMGAWIRAEPGMIVRMFVTSPPKGIAGAIAEHRGDGAWHWVTTHLQARYPLEAVRPHVNLAAPGAVEVFSPRVVAGPVVRAEHVPKDRHPVVMAIERRVPQSIDLASFRVNQVEIINGLSANELMTNNAIVARTPTYGGVDSDLTRDFLALLTTFVEHDPRWHHRAGIYSNLESPRLLDLLGVAYDADAAGNVVVRPGAIPRFAAFARFEAPAGREGVLKRLKDADFDPATTVLLETGAAATPPPGEGRFVKLDYRALNTDRLELRVPADVPRIVLFNDRYSRHWAAEWNGAQLRIVRANGIFMGVVLPEGAGQLTFSFRPALFLVYSRLSMAIAVMLGLLAITVACAGFLRRRRSSLEAHSK